MYTAPRSPTLSPAARVHTPDTAQNLCPGLPFSSGLGQPLPGPSVTRKGAICEFRACRGGETTIALRRGSFPACQPVRDHSGTGSGPEKGSSRRPSGSLALRSLTMHGQRAGPGPQEGQMATAPPACPLLPVPAPPTPTLKGQNSLTTVCAHVILNLLSSIVTLISPRIMACTILR